VTGTPSSIREHQQSTRFSLTMSIHLHFGSDWPSRTSSMRAPTAFPSLRSRSRT
jgi:hypothetical protein